ncbi:substrate-binding domain-containing protein [Aureimonas phyllosphaerae]|uniref:Ribose transport system substrate-binding protein n=1 Tax=Aureimonas phyllosphaerae TaxID=1166078 RepID=A0A7W6BVB5_9HYPH|nr:substrate-binding domain-containing protein [Aureimonas phyllosphaerae]MBB3935743.1 ribose transport system substrate-binding protein [Aureimonas phyllosphaerae]MBB3959751.1 ribose transport system substrate-binding protein [Aureimonas phyllosphaerae]SFF14580.1 ribose transport system substrate-binding protein [Aureimonas phyllosphaerae]
MRKGFWSTLVLGSALMGAVLPASAEGQEDLIKPIDKELTFVFIPKVIHPWYDVVRQGGQYAVDEFAKQGIKINMIWDQPPQADVADQNQRIEANIGRAPDGLAVACLDQATNVQLLTEAKEAGVNTITFNSFCSPDFAFVGQKDSYGDGFDLGKYLADHIGGEGEVGILSGSLTATDHVERIKGFKKALEAYPNVKIVFEQPDNDVLEEAVSLTENALQAHPNIKGFFGCNASNPIGIARAVQNAGKAGTVAVVGMDDLPEAVDFVKEGVITALKAQRQWDIGYWAVKYMVAMNQNHTIPMDHNTGSRFITKDQL